MGLFDGVEAARRTGSTADLAAHFGLPSCSSSMSRANRNLRRRSSADSSHTIRSEDRGVVLNRVGSERHRKFVADAIEALGVRVIGSVPRDETIALPERHLGLVQAGEHGDLGERLDHLATMAETHLDLDRILKLAEPARLAEVQSEPALPPPGSRIALAQDAAFTFVYPHVLDGWRCAGAEMVAFSPLAGEPPPEDCDSCWLPGGYPELHAGRLAAAHKFRDGLARFAATRPVHGECGGYMVLGEMLEDADGISHPMAGLLGHATSFARRKLHLGYREATLLADSPIGRAGSRLRGHEFHYAALVATSNDAPLVELADGQGQRLGTGGGRRGLVTGTFFHAIATA
jgi:cobyrinic acid a,c-diamide synthase